MYIQHYHVWNRQLVGKCCIVRGAQLAALWWPRGWGGGQREAQEGGSMCILFTCSVVSNSLQPCRLQHVRLPCPSLSPRVCSNSCLLNQWWHPTISSSVIPFSSCLQSFPASGSFPMSRLFESGGQNIGASASVLPINIKDWFPLGLTGFISFYPRGSQESSPILQFESINSSVLSRLDGPTLIYLHDYWKNHNFDSLDLCWQSDVSAF